MLSAPSPRVIAVTYLGIHIIVLLVDSAGDLFQGTLIDISRAAILCRQVRSRVLPRSTSGMVIVCGRGCF